MLEAQTACNKNSYVQRNKTEFKVGEVVSLTIEPQRLKSLIEDLNVKLSAML
eukprot:c3977_g1_i1 orf=121-276(+)